MHTDTGKIVELTKEDMNEEVELLKKKLTRLTHKEYNRVSQVEEGDRPLELALMRFVEERKKLGAPCSISARNAFKLGYLAAKKDLKGDSGA